MKTKTLRTILRPIGDIAALLLLTASAWPQLFSYTELNQRVNDIAYSPITGMLYASVPSTGGQYGNHLIVIDPKTGAIVNSVFAGSEPNKLAMTNDGRYLYVGVDGAASVKRFVLASLTLDISISLGIGNDGPYIAEDIAPIPGRPNVVAVSRRDTCCSPRHEGVVLFDNGIQLSNITSANSETNEIEAGDDGTSLYGYNNETSGFQFRQLYIDSNGVYISSSEPNTFGAYSLKIRYSAGRVYASNGKIVEAANGNPVGMFSLGGFADGIAVDKRNSRVLFVMGSSLKAFRTTTFQPIGTVNLPTSVDTPAQLTRWGRRGVAYRTSGGKLALAESLLVTQKSQQ